MQRLEINERLEADCVAHDGSRVGEVYYVQRNRAGGATLTPIARYFAWRPEFAENFHPHWRIDCYVRKHRLAPNPESVGRALTQTLLRQGLIDEPVWTSWHTSRELKGEASGEVFDLD